MSSLQDPERVSETGPTGLSAAEITGALARVRARIEQAERKFGRPPGSVSLLAVSKKKPPEVVRIAYGAGQTAFGENHAQEAVAKMDALADLPLEWHFIGPVQSNKTRPIAARFDWVHSIDRIKVARRLDGQRPDDLPPIKVCIQINVSDEPSKSGIRLDEMVDFAREIGTLPRLELRGLMAIPEPSTDFEAQRIPMRKMRGALEALKGQGMALDTLSMGMTDDMEAAIAEGATVVRVGTAIFGSR